MGVSATDIFSAAISNGKIYIGGLFTQLAVTTGGGAFVWSDSAKPIGSTYCPQLDLYDENLTGSGTISEAVMDPDGNLYILGKFTHVQSFPRRNLAKIKPNCQLDLAFDAKINDTSAIFYDLLYLEGRIFFSGSFQTSTGALTNYPTPTIRHHVASVNAITGLMDDWAPNVSGVDVRCMETDGTFIYIGGGFTAINSNGVGNIGKLHKDNGTTFYPIVDADGTVNAMLIRNGILYVGGVFSTLNASATSRSKIAAIELATNTVLPAFSSINIFGNAVYAILAYNDELYIGGEITGPRFGLLKTDLNGNVLAADYSIDGSQRNVYKLSLIDDKLYVFGFFETVRSEPKNHIFQLDLKSDTVTTWDPKFLNGNSELQGVALKFKENVIFLGGAFGAIDTTQRNYLAELDSQTGIPTDWNPNPNDLVSRLIISDKRLFLHGQFTIISDTARQTMAAYDLDSKSLLSWDPEFPPASVESMLIDGDTMYVGGNFTTVNGNPVNRLVKIDTIQGNLDTNFNPNPGNTVRSLQLLGDELYVVGQFNTIPNAATYLASVNRNSGTFIKTHTQSLTGFSAYGSFISDQRFIMSGQYQVTAPYNGFGLTFYQIPDLSTITPSSTFPSTSEFVRSIHQNQTKIYLGGNFPNFGGRTRNGLFSLNRNDLSINDWDAKLATGSTIYQVIAEGNVVYAFGNINAANQKYRAGMVKLDSETGNSY
ncbi:hypothetical protein LEP1GSC202_2255 [Leptospira yanagawae serovar Saopaulo str. Sao Paulo = ATCC 700523]|uniref:Beta-propeller repeat protein n=1 Tax=Leptospira yanagawae serovar Saopaulo str. Sao Paulo = ATCC 700523 TaxID=1249483 RepID=A0A5E8HCM7_9LEPT|nr:hypothetical protein LEP1GSC202_2255 [Leptospira yanagawae serovar Saopaulo str. Sao Paulo = ATCC 700523]